MRQDGAAKERGSSEAVRGRGGAATGLEERERRERKIKKVWCKKTLFFLVGPTRRIPKKHPWKGLLGF